MSALNAIAAAVVMRRGIHSTGEAVGAAVGAVGTALILAFHFGDVMRGGRGLRGLRIAPA